MDPRAWAPLHKGWRSYCHCWMSSLPAMKPVLSPQNGSMPIDNSQPLDDKLTALDTFHPGNGSNFFWLELLRSGYGLPFLPAGPQPAPLSWVFTECLTHWHRVPHNTESDQRAHCTSKGVWQWHMTMESTGPTTFCTIQKTPAWTERRSSLWRHSWGASTEMLPTKDGHHLQNTVYTLSAIRRLPWQSRG